MAVKERQQLGQMVGIQHGWGSSLGPVHRQSLSLSLSLVLSLRAARYILLITKEISGDGEPDWSMLCHVN